MTGKRADIFASQASIEPVRKAPLDVQETSGHSTPQAKKYDSRNRSKKVIRTGAQSVLAKANSNLPEALSI